MSAADPARIRGALRPHTAAGLDELEVFASIDSTNRYLLHEPAPNPRRARVAIADEQTAGRGRRDRSWVSPRGSGLYLSFAYTFDRQPAGLAALTLAFGVDVATAIREADIAPVMLKWPNDLILRDGKVGGILTETHASQHADSIAVVTGLGINIAFGAPLEFKTAPVQRPIDLQSAADTVPSRNELAVLCIDALYACCERFSDRGFAGFVAAWSELDWLRGQTVTVVAVDKSLCGIAAGADPDGALLIDTDRGRERVISGTVVAAQRGERCTQ